MVSHYIEKRVNSLYENFLEFFFPCIFKLKLHIILMMICHT